MPAVGSMRGSIPASVGMVQQEVEEIISYLKKHDVLISAWN